MSNPRKIWAAGVLVDVLEPGHYVHPATGTPITLSGYLGSHSGPGFVMTGWPTYWQELVPDTDVKRARARLDVAEKKLMSAQQAVEEAAAQLRAVSA